jgi:hypothetical protein
VGAVERDRDATLVAEGLRACHFPALPPLDKAAEPLSREKLEHLADQHRLLRIHYIGLLFARRQQHYK